MTSSTLEASLVVLRELEKRSVFQDLFFHSLATPLGLLKTLKTTTFLHSVLDFEVVEMK